MLSTIWQSFLVTPLFNVLVAFEQLTNSLGIAIILLTILIRLVLVPVVVPSMRAMKKQRDLQPELDKLKKKYKHDKKLQAEKQMELFKEHGINPAAGCLTQIPMLIVLIALFSVIRKFSEGLPLSDINSLIYFDSLKFQSLAAIKTNFLWLDLTSPDPYYILAVVAGFFQFLASKMTQPYVEAGEKAAKKTPDKTDDIAYNMQEQMMFIMPLLTVFIGLRLPSGTVLYILATTIFSVFQTYYISGLGGLKPYVNKLNKLLSSKN